MVFLIPYIFGSSVMVDIATAGSTRRAQPGVLLPAEPWRHGRVRAPILLRLPHLNDWRGEDIIIGLGDIIIPGLLLSYALRTDYTLLRGPNARAAKGRVGYWIVALVGYFLALGITNMAVSWRYRWASRPSCTSSRSPWGPSARSRTRAGSCRPCGLDGRWRLLHVGMAREMEQEVDKDSDSNPECTTSHGPGWGGLAALEAGAGPPKRSSFRYWA